MICFQIDRVRLLMYIGIQSIYEKIYDSWMKKGGRGD